MTLFPGRLSPKMFSGHARSALSEGTKRGTVLGLMSGGGDSAVSTGPMVPVLASNDEGRSRSALALLESHGIPAVIDADLEGAFVGFHDPVPQGWSQVLVPTSMRSEALELLRSSDHGRRSRPATAFEVPRPGARGPRSPKSLPPRAAELGLHALTRGVGGQAPGLAPGDEGDDELEELRLPEPPPVEGRLSVALMAVAFGGVAQRVLSGWFGPDTVIERLGAKAPIWDEPFRLVTASFLHAGPAHFLSNAAFGLVFGVVLFGTHRVGAAALTWCLASVVGMSAELALSPEAVVVGASAGNYGLVGLWARGQFQRSRLAVLPRRERLKTLGVLLLLVPGALTPFSSTGTRIAVLAHVAGFLSGYLAGSVFRRRLLPEDLDQIDLRSRVAGLLALSLASAGWVFGLLQFL